MIRTDPRDAINVEFQPCEISRNDECNGLADGQCEECGQLICRFPSCSVELPSGLLLCVDCDEAIKTAAEKEQPIAA